MNNYESIYITNIFLLHVKSLQPQKKKNVGFPGKNRPRDHMEASRKRSPKENSLRS